MLVDLAAIGLLSKSPEAAIGLYAVGGPTVHAVHGNSLRAGASVALRLGLPIIGAIVLGAADNCEQTEYEKGKDINHCTIPTPVIGAGAGAILAMVLDDTVLSYVPGTESKATEVPANQTHWGPDKERVRARDADSGVRFSGGVSVTPQRSEVVITGVF
jgi:energy-converting hydrogenase Eha subunit A